MVEFDPTAVGSTLRAVRLRRGLTLREAADRSGGRFKPSSIAGYERAERAISLERFCELAHLYGIPADRLLGEVMDRLDPEGRRAVIIDLRDLEARSGREAQVVREHVRDVRAARGDLEGDVVTLRSGDLDVLARITGGSPMTIMTRLAPVVRPRRGEPNLESERDERGPPAPRPAP